MSSLRIVSGSANPRLAESIADALDVTSEASAVERFPDGELRPRVEHVGGHDVYVVQPTAPPANDSLMELLLLLDACRRARARRVTAVVPYLGYVRQDRRTHTGESLGARLVCEAIAQAGAERLVVVDPHTPTLEAMSPIPVETLSAVPLLASRLTAGRTDRTVVVAPDLGAGPLAERYAAALGTSVAIVRKFRQSGTEVSAVELIGDIEGRPTVIVDDMIATGATIEASLHILHYHARDVVVAATHGPLLPAATERLRALGLRRVLVTDTVAHRDSAAPLDVCSVGPLLADAIARLHQDRPLAELAAHR
ncbi:ribose-phosphate diphosphokinase [Nocardia otitidiscaviarum]|uniref:ribose-phosphate diphosphokinase n=1 Tax=Nocardia otitidiscaviarum TaxID=1823 RepID=UPI00163DE2F2|nr:ribose-phosphate pyrophosphokinase [Nocardia otitidiscaviarum]MBF6181163.1 ribose-phosphate pyrophosphokinase [Nocardia otitidiscaviarum]MCP9619474.1 ribose-phosphate pyrophosphokinase [Nocardia otitidiscaviarum]